MSIGPARVFSGRRDLRALVDSSLDALNEPSRSASPNAERELTRFLPVLVDESGDDLDDLLLLAARELAYFLEDALDLSDGARVLREHTTVSEEIFDLYAEDASELWQHVGAWWLRASLPEGDIGLGLPDELSELDLAEASGAAELDEAGSLARAWFGQRTTHAGRSVRAVLRGTCERAPERAFRLTALFRWRQRWPGSPKTKSSS